MDNDQTLCEFCEPSLSSICPNHEEVGYQAARLLKDWLAGKPPAEETRVAPRTIVVRHSSDILSVTDETVVVALRYIHDNSHLPIKIDDVARSACVSRSVLQRRFRAVLDSTVLGEILRTRIKRVQSFLAETDLPLNEIAIRCGFNHQEYLGYVFKQRMNDTPAAYRSRIKGVPKK